MRMARRCIVIVAVLVTLPACRQQRHEAAAADMAKIVAEDRAHHEEIARDEQRFVATLKRTKALAEQGAPSALYEVANSLDSNYQALKNRERVAKYPIVRTIHPPKQIEVELITK